MGLGKSHEEQEAEEARKKSELDAEREEHNRRVAKGGSELPDVGANAGPKED